MLDLSSWMPPLVSRLFSPHPKCRKLGSRWCVWRVRLSLISLFRLDFQWFCVSHYWGAQSGRCIHHMSNDFQLLIYECSRIHLFDPHLSSYYFSSTSQECIHFPWAHRWKYPSIQNYKYGYLWIGRRKLILGYCTKVHPIMCLRRSRWLFTFHQLS